MPSKSYKTLYIIGNGFDLTHGVKSSYYAFKEYLNRRDKSLSFELDTYFECENFWGDFENNLAFLSREMVMESVDTMLDLYMETVDEDDDDFSYADYFAAIEMGTQVVPDLTERLPKCFKQWIRTLQPVISKNIVCQRVLRKEAMYINFNYTEFLETLYGISAQQILYIHGDRRNQKKQLVLGHGRDPDTDFVDWFERRRKEDRFTASHSCKSGKNQNDNLTYLTYFLEDEQEGQWRNPMRYYAADVASGIVEGYFSDTAKQTEEIIRYNQVFFDSLVGVDEIIVIGHSLAPVDHPYFNKIIKQNSDLKHLRWKFSWYSDGDKERIKKFCAMMAIDERNMEMFRLD